MNCLISSLTSINVKRLCGCDLQDVEARRCVDQSRYLRSRIISFLPFLFLTSLFYLCSASYLYCSFLQLIVFLHLLYSFVFLLFLSFYFSSILSTSLISTPLLLVTQFPLSTFLHLFQPQYYLSYYTKNNHYIMYLRTCTGPLLYHWVADVEDNNDSRYQQSIEVRALVLYCTVLYCTVLYCTALHCTALYCTALHYTVLHCTALYCTLLYYAVLYCTVLHCTVLYCTVLYCTVLYYTVLH